MLSKKPYLLRAHFQWILDNNWTPYILVNATYPNVKVPEQYVRDGKIVLDISPNACRDLEIAAEYLKFSARFSGQLWQMALPLPAIRAIYAKENSEGMTFHEEAPVETKSPKKPIFTLIRNDKEQ